MTNSLVLFIACLLMFGLLFAEKWEKALPRLFFKAPLSFLFILAAFLQPRPVLGYALYIITGLVFCGAGDIFLALSWPRAFLFGLIAFLLGHVFYIIAFFSMAPMSSWAWIELPVIALLGGSIFMWLRPRLGQMKLPVMAYIGVISLMLLSALSMAVKRDISFAARWMAFSGAFLFYVSDLFVARNRFLEKAFLNRLIGLPMYYVGQFLLAFSVGWIG